MNVYNKFLERIQHKNRINSILYEDINDKLLSKQERTTPLNLLLSSRPRLKEDINKIKLKYGYSQQARDQRNIHDQISNLKNKYIKNSANKYKINNVNVISYVNKEEKKCFNRSESYQNNENNLIRRQSDDIVKMRDNTSFYNNNNNNEKEKLSPLLSTERLINNINNNNYSLNENQNIKEKKESEYENYLKNTRNDFYLVDKKVNEILQNERLSPEKNNKFNNIYPISQRINMLNNIKNEIKVVNKNFENTINNSSLSQASGSYTTIGFKYINPKIKKTSIYRDIFESKNDEYGSFYSNEISKDNEIEKPILIRSLSKPKLKVMRFSKFCNTVEE